METALDAEATVEVVEAPSEDERVIAWRQERIVRMGYGDDEAASLASESSVDLHYLEGLLVAGCSLELAKRIV